ncbi:sugar phosphate isomerase/epimerase [Candidatus Bipolaricaulota bacterium]|nr:sugar phosphate isomerase/epimerase [Candidatus Bipolaricaulota bacterium]
MDLDRVGLSTFLWTGMSVERWVELAGELGLGGVELRADPRAAFPPELAPTDRRRLRQGLAEKGLWCTVHVPIYGVNLASPVPSLAAAALGEVVGAVDLAADVGAELVVVHPGHVDPDYLPLDGERDRAAQRFRFALEVILARARRRGVEVTVENKQRSPGWDMVHTAAEHRVVLDLFPALGACLDFGHLHTTGGEPAPYVAALGERLVHVHLHDNRGERDEHLPLGAGTVPWQAALAALERGRYGGRIVLEIPDPAGVRESVAAVLKR